MLGARPPCHRQALATLKVTEGEGWAGGERLVASEEAERAGRRAGSHGRVLDCTRRGLSPQPQGEVAEGAVCAGPSSQAAEPPIKPDAGGLSASPLLAGSPHSPAQSPWGGKNILLPGLTAHSWAPAAGTATSRMRRAQSPGDGAGPGGGASGSKACPLPPLQQTQCLLESGVHQFQSGKHHSYDYDRHASCTASFSSARCFLKNHPGVRCSPVWS